MMKFLSSFCLLFLCFTMAQGQSAQIDIEVKNYDNDTLIIGYYYANKQLVKDSIIRNSQGHFSYQSQDSLHAGLYLLLVQPTNDYMQFMVNDNTQKFKIKVDANKLDEPTFEGNEDSDLFYSYLEFLKKHKPKAEKLRAEISQGKEKNKDTSKKENELNLIDDKVNQKQSEIIAAKPQSITALLLNSSKNVKVPNELLVGTEEEQGLAKFHYYQEHYLDHIDLKHPASIYVPATFQKVDTYIKNLTVQHPDSLIQTMDALLTQMPVTSQTFKYFLSNFINRVHQSKQVGMDAVYVHLGDKYYSKGLAPWMEADKLKKLMADVRSLKPLLIGKTAPDLTLYKEDGSPVTISEIDAEYKVLLFWAPNCPHCTKAMPHAVDFYEKFKDKGVEIISICTKTGKKLSKCWDSVKDKKMGAFLNVGDEYGKSRFKSKYYIKQTPKIYVLDREMKILVKDIGAEHLEEVINGLMKGDLLKN